MSDVEELLRFWLTAIGILCLILFALNVVGLILDAFNAPFARYRARATLAANNEAHDPESQIESPSTAEQAVPSSPPVAQTYSADSSADPTTTEVLSESDSVISLPDFPPPAYEGHRQCHSST